MSDTAVTIGMIALSASVLVFALLFWLSGRRRQHGGLGDELRRQYEQRLLDVNSRYTYAVDEATALKEEKGRLLGEQARMTGELQELRARLEASERQGQFLERENSRLTHREEARIRETERLVRELDASRRALEEERQRVVSDEKERQREYESNRDRIWALHEQESVARMREICTKAEYGFDCYDNTALPGHFDASLKPDFLLSFLGQYIIFDAKSSKSGNLQTYLQNQVKSTVQKIRNSTVEGEIYRTLFFVVPTIALDSLKSFSYVEGGYSVFIIPLQAFEPVIATFRKLQDYDLAEAYDPAERENVVHLIAAYDNHIRQQNAVNILNSLRGLRVMGEKQSLPGDLAEEVEQRRRSMRLDTFKPSDLKRLMNDPVEQISEVAGLIRPSEPEVRADDIAAQMDEAADHDKPD